MLSRVTRVGHASGVREGEGRVRRAGALGEVEVGERGAAAHQLGEHGLRGRGRAQAEVDQP